MQFICHASFSTMSVTPERYRQVDRLYQRALERAPEQRQAFLAEACDGDEALRREVESLLAAEDKAPVLLERSLGDVAAAVVPQGTTETMVGRKLGPSAA